MECCVRGDEDHSSSPRRLQRGHGRHPSRRLYHSQRLEGILYANPRFACERTSDYLLLLCPDSSTLYWILLTPDSDPVRYGRLIILLAPNNFCALRSFSGVPTTRTGMRALTRGRWSLTNQDSRDPGPLPSPTCLSEGGQGCAPGKCLPVLRSSSSCTTLSIGSAGSS